jgi:hypothetical protein
MKLASVTVVALLAAATPSAADAGAPAHPDLTLPSAAAKPVEPEAPTELEPIEVTGRKNPMDLAIDRAKLLVDLRCKLCKDADFSVKGVPADRFQEMFLGPADNHTRNISIALYSRCADNPGVYASCFMPALMPLGNFKEGEVTRGMWTEFVRLVKGQ